jgi:hypothetical protein
VDTEHPTIMYLCPTCRHGEGRPRSVVCQGGQKILHLVCDSCGCEWDDVSVDASALFGPPPRYSGLRSSGRDSPN